jgi:serine protease Do
MNKTRTSVVIGALATAFLSLGAGDTGVVKLKSGAQVQGEILKQTDRRVWIDIGDDVLQIDMEQVHSVDRAEVAPKLESDARLLYSTAKDLPTLPPKELSKSLGPAVIKVSTPGGLGSGVIISPDGYAITNAHVIQGERALRATVWFRQADGSLKRADIDDVEIEAVNSAMDMALIKIKHPDGKPFEVAPVEQDESVEAGQRVFAIGNPLGLERTLTEGVVSVPAMQMEGRTYIQTDTPINPGNSGGPLFNLRGEVVGITNMKITRGENVGFAIPSRYLKDFVRHREAFAFDKNNPNSGHFYHVPPPRPQAGAPGALQDGNPEPVGTPSK